MLPSPTPFPRPFYPPSSPSTRFVPADLRALSTSPSPLCAVERRNAVWNYLQTQRKYNPTFTPTDASKLRITLDFDLQQVVTLVRADSLLEIEYGFCTCKYL